MSLILLTFMSISSSSTHSDCFSPPRGHVSFRDTQQSTLIGNIQNFITKRKIRSTGFQSSTLKMTANIFLLTKLQINPGSKMTVKKRHRWNRKHEQCFQKQSFLKLKKRKQTKKRKCFLAGCCPPSAQEFQFIASSQEIIWLHVF